ncbi:MAG: PorV/PorQ family protein [Actinobacteria bacterium]|nr:PorV/PorQ family protein [Actinomycetota bacterium]
MSAKLQKYFLSVFFVFLLIGDRAFAQSTINKNEWGGVNDIFDLPVGARAMAMGGAYVSLANDPFALYWNAAALENVQQMGLGLYYSNLPGGSRYNYLAFTYPTLFFGTFSAGYLGIGTGGIGIADEDGARYGEEDYGRSLFLLGYGYRFFDWLSVGTTLKIERAKFPDLINDATGNITESAFGADAGVLVTPQFDAFFLQNMTIGLNIQNIIRRSMRAAEISESSPRNVRLGVAKSIFINDNANQVTMALEININEKMSTVPTHFNFGLEYSYRNYFMLRAGYDHSGRGGSGNGPTYGAGFKHLNIQLDYSFWSGYDALMGSSHRISLVYNIGKTRKKRMEEYNAREVARIQRQVINQLEMKRREEISSGKAQARLYFNNDDYIRAYREINKVLSYDEEGNDAEFADARLLLDQINNAIKAQRDKELAAEVARSAEEARIKRNQQMVKEHYEKALAYFESEEYPDAISECNRALEIDPQSELVQDLKAKANEDLRQKLVDLVTKARGLEKSGRLMEAIPYYNQARRLARNNKEWETRIASWVSSIERKLSYDDLLRRAANHERSRDWSAAADLYKQALKYEPGNPVIRKKYDEAYARANAREMDMPSDVKDLYLKGSHEFTAGNFDKALQYFESARKLQPFNKTILRAIDVAKEEKRKRQTATGR